MARAANASYHDKIACLILLAWQSGHPFICRECNRPILPGQAVQFDHRHAVGRGGQNRVEDLAPVHAAKRGSEDGAGNPLDCHDRKTFRPRGGATTLGGDNYEAKKTDRMPEKHAVHKRAPGQPRPPSAWGSRRFQNGNRGFPPRGSRPMNKKRRA